MNEETEVKETYTKWQHEREMTRIEIQCKRWFIGFLIVLAMLFLTNGAWIIYEMQFQTVTVTNEVDTGEGDAEVYGIGIGDVNYGESKTNDSGQGQKGTAGN